MAPERVYSILEVFHRYWDDEHGITRNASVRGRKRYGCSKRNDMLDLLVLPTLIEQQKADPRLTFFCKQVIARFFALAEGKASEDPTWGRVVREMKRTPDRRHHDMYERAINIPVCHAERWYESSVGECGGVSLYVNGTL
jgi:hypothetical protein